MSDYAAKNEKDLMKTLSEKQESLRVFNFSLAGGRAKNVKEGRGLRKEIAQIMTAITTINARKN